MRILNGLSEVEAYKNVISSLYSYATEKGDHTDPDYITGRLIDECKMYNFDSSKPKQIKGSVLKTILSKPIKSKKKQMYVCWSCWDKDPKHVCEKMFCPLCGERGHRAKNCSKRPQSNQESNSHEARVSMMAGFDLTDSFYVDSGASHHITKDLTNLHDYQLLHALIRLETSKNGVFITLLENDTLKYTLNDTDVTIADVHYS